MSSQAARKRLRRHQRTAPTQCSIDRAVSEDNADFVPELAESVKNRLDAEAGALWDGWMRQLARCAKRLDSQGCWQFYHENRNAAICWNLEKELHRVVLLAAEQFARAGAARVTNGKHYA